MKNKYACYLRLYLGWNTPEPNPQEIFDTIDINKDGRIVLEEMKKSIEYIKSKRCKMSIKVCAYQKLMNLL